MAVLDKYKVHELPIILEVDYHVGVTVNLVFFSLGHDLCHSEVGDFLGLRDPALCVLETALTGSMSPSGTAALDLRLTSARTLASLGWVGSSDSL